MRIYNYNGLDLINTTNIDFRDAFDFISKNPEMVIKIGLSLNDARIVVSINGAQLKEINEKLNVEPMTYTFQKGIIECVKFIKEEYDKSISNKCD